MKKYFEKMKGLLIPPEGEKDEKGKKEKTKNLAVTIGLCFLIGVIVVSFGSSKKRKMVKGVDGQQVNTKGKDKVSDFMIGSVEQRAYVEALEKDYHSVNDRVAKLEKTITEMKDSQKDIGKIMLNMNESMKNKTEEMMDLIEQKSREDKERSKFDPLNLLFKANPLGIDEESIDLQVVDIMPIREERDNTVYLPIGSFCKGTLLTGVYASSNESQPLPVLIALDEAFYGPNKTRIPLKGAFAIGKAVGDLVSERAKIQVVSMSTVLPDTITFEHESNLGWITDENGLLGVPGIVTYNTGRQMFAGFMAGFASGAAEAFADAEQTTVVSSSGTVTSAVTGDSGKAAAFSGMAQSASQLSEHFFDRIDEMVPAIKIENNKTIYFVVQKGVKIEGLQTNPTLSYRFVD